VRDTDLFKRFKKHELGLTITTLNESVKKVFEPFSPSSHARLDALKKLKEEGFYTYVFIGPILPYLTDLEEIFKEISPFVDHLSFEDLNLNPCKKEVFEAIRKNFPELEEKYKNLSKEFWLEKEKEIKKLGEKYNKPKKLGEKYNKPIRIYFKHTGSLKFK
jgi:DNA repair photolyase